MLINSKVIAIVRKFAEVTDINKVKLLLHRWRN